MSYLYCLIPLFDASLYNTVGWVLIYFGELIFNKRPMARQRMKLLAPYWSPCHIRNSHLVYTQTVSSKPKMMNVSNCQGMRGFILFILYIFEITGRKDRPIIWNLFRWLSRFGVTYEFGSFLYPEDIPPLK